jgi:hypothetical protein
MATKDEVKQFLKEFLEKKKIWGILYRDDRGKNAQALADLEIRPFERDKVIEALIAEDYCEGPKEEKLHKGADMWVFGKRFKNKDIYIKVSMGWKGAQVICISFHTAEQNINYPLKS